MDIQPSVLRNMASLGLMAADQGRIHEAERIFQGLAAVRPDHEAVLLGLAYTRMNIGAYDEALDILHNKAMALYPDNEILTCFCGLALHLDGKPGAARDLLDPISASGKNPLAVNLAINLLAELKG